MTPEKHDPWALLREAKRLIAANRLMLGHYSGVREVGSLEDRIDAAMREAAAKLVEREVEGWMQLGLSGDIRALPDPEDK